MHRNALLAPLVVALTACGGGRGSLAPSPITNTPPLVSGRWLIQLSGDSFACGDVKSPQAGTSVQVVVPLTRSSDGWSGRSADGLEFRFQIAGSDPLGWRLTGTISGSALDEGYPGAPAFGPPPSGTRLAVTGSVPLSGTMPLVPTILFGTGTIDGTVVFSRDGVSSTCPAGAVGWSAGLLTS